MNVCVSFLVHTRVHQYVEIRRVAFAESVLREKKTKKKEEKKKKR